MTSRKKIIEIIGVPSDLGANMRGSSLGPMAVRMAGLLARIEENGFTVIDRGDLAIPLREHIADRDGKYLLAIAEIVASLMMMVKTSLDNDRFPIMMGGDHSLAIGSIYGVAAHLVKKRCGLIWVDAHGDFNTPSSSESGNIHGMPLATVLGCGHDILVNLGLNTTRISPSNVALIGLRSVDRKERERLRASGIHYFTMKDIDEKGMTYVAECAVTIASRDTDGVHLSFDLDSVDPVYAPGVSTPVTGGLTVREARLLLEKIHDHCDVLSMDFVELNPLNDINNRTAMLCVDLIERVLGKRIV